MSVIAMYHDRRTISHCLWCRQSLVDGADLSGFTGVGPDYMTKDGDFGCDNSPDSNTDGVGQHTPDTMTTWDGHTVRVALRSTVRHKHPRLD